MKKFIGRSRRAMPIKRRGSMGTDLKFIKTFILSTVTTTDSIRLTLEKAFGKTVKTCSDKPGRKKVYLESGRVMLNLLQLPCSDAVTLGMSIFLSNFGIYFVTFNVRALLQDNGGEKDFLSHWSWALSTYAPRAKAFFIGIGECSRAEQKEVNRRVLQCISLIPSCHQPNMRDEISFYHICQNSSQLTHLQKALSEVCQDPQFAGNRKVPVHDWTKEFELIVNELGSGLFHGKDEVFQRVYDSTEDIRDQGQMIKFCTEEKTWLLKNNYLALPEMFLETFQEFLLKMEPLKSATLRYDECMMSKETLDGVLQKLDLKHVELFRAVCTDHQLLLPLQNEMFSVAAVAPIKREERFQKLHEESPGTEAYKIILVMKNFSPLMDIVQSFCLLAATNTNVLISKSDGTVIITVNDVWFEPTEKGTNMVVLSTARDIQAMNNIPAALETINSLKTDNFELLLVNPIDDTEWCTYKSLKNAIKDNKDCVVLKKQLHPRRPIAMFSPFYDTGRTFIASENASEPETPTVYDCFLAHEWDAHEEVRVMKETLESQGFTVWFDEDQMGTNSNTISREIMEGLTNSRLVICCITKRYIERTNDENTVAAKELQWAVKNKGSKTMIGVFLEPDIFGQAIWRNSLVGFNLPDKLLLDFSTDSEKKRNWEKLRMQLEEPRLYVTMNSRMRKKRFSNKRSWRHLCSWMNRSLMF